MWAAGATAIVIVTYLPNTWKSIWLWKHERSARAFRGMFLSVMIFLGLVRILFGSLQRAFPNIDPLQVLNEISAPILTLMLLIGGIVTFYTWRKGVT